MSKLTHIEAFCSPDAKRGRVWTDGENFYRRTKDGAMQESSKGKTNSYWYNCLVQVAAMEGEVTWADEPKLLTPQEALRALADGKVIEDGDFRFRLGSFGKIETLHIEETEWEPMEDLCFVGCHVAPDPSQPAEPARPPLKVGDRVKIVSNTYAADGRVVGSLGTVRAFNNERDVDVQCDSEIYTWCFDSLDLEKIEAAPQVEFPLSYAAALVALHDGLYVSNEMYSWVTYRINNGSIMHRNPAQGKFDFVACDNEFNLGDKKARWRIVDKAGGGK